MKAQTFPDSSIPKNRLEGNHEGTWKCPKCEKHFPFNYSKKHLKLHKEVDKLEVKARINHAKS